MCPALRIVKLHVSWTAINVTPCVVSVTNSDHVHKKCVLTKILTDQKSFDIMFKSLFLCKLAFIVHFLMLYAILQLFLESYILVVSVTKLMSMKFYLLLKLMLFQTNRFDLFCLNILPGFRQMPN